MKKRIGNNRSFILKTDKTRQEECRNKFVIDKNVLDNDKTVKNKNVNLKNKIVFFVDDSLVRGNTIKVIIDILKELEPKEIHFRIASPKVISPCYFGIDIPSKEELIMNHFTDEDFCKVFNIDSLSFLTLEEMSYAIKNFNGSEISNYCTGCFSKKYNDMLDF